MKWIKRIVMLVIALVLVAILVAVAFVMTVNPNDYKDQIARVIQKETGRTVQFNGPISLSLFPWLGVTLKDVSLGNAIGFSDKTMLSAREVEAKAAVLPLLHGQFEVGRLVLSGAIINLTRDKAGRTNWADLVAHEQSAAVSQSAASPTSAEAKPKALALAIGGVSIEDATLNWRDEMTGQSAKFDQVFLDSGPITLNKPIQFDMHFGYALQQPGMANLSGKVQLGATVLADMSAQQLTVHKMKLAASVQRGTSDKPSTLPKQTDLTFSSPELTASLAKHVLSLPSFSATVKASGLQGLTYADATAGGDLQADWQQGVYQSKSLNLSGDLKGIGTHTGELHWKATGGLQANLTQGTADLKDWRLSSDPVVVTTSLKLTGLTPVAGKTSALSVSGPLVIAPFNPRQLADVMKYRVPVMQSDKALTQFALQGQVQVTPDKAMLEDMKLDLDGQSFTGSVGLSDLKAQRLYARLKGGVFDANPYLPPGSGTASAAPARSAGADGAHGSKSGSALASDEPIPLPIEALRHLNADVGVQLAQLTYQKYILKNLQLALTASGGQISLSKLDFNAFGGAVQSQAGLDVRSAVPDWRAKLNTQHLALEPALTAAMGQPSRLSGTGDVSMDVRAQGDRLSKIKASLDGDARFALKDGQVKGVDLGYMLRAAQARLQGGTEAVPKDQATDFSTITGTAVITNGLVRNNDLQGASPLLRVSGKGTVDLARDALDYVLTAIVVNTATGQGGKALDKLKKLEIPIKITGTFAQPKFGIDLQGLFEGQAKQKVQEKLKQELDKRLGNGAAPVQNLLKKFGL